MEGTQAAEGLVQDKSGAWRANLLEAMKRTAPIILGYLPVGFAYGVLAQKTGLSDLNTVLMSIIVFAGSSQLVAVGLLAAGAGPWAVIAATFVVNLRHLLMSAALSPHLRGWRPWQIAAFTFELTDESFAVHSDRFESGDKRKAVTFLVNTIAQASWIGGTGLGLLASGLIGDVRPIGLDYALPAMFIALLAARLKNRPQVLVALVSAAASILFFKAGAGQWSVIFATCLGATFGLGVLAWTKKPSS